MIKKYLLENIHIKKSHLDLVNINKKLYDLDSLFLHYFYIMDHGLNIIKLKFIIGKNTMLIFNL
jgi:hypothetical protein